jgi:hypothetical protein
MDDLDFDRELRATMAATPSPEFVARVRAKVAEASGPSIVPGWLKPAAAIACAAVVALVVGLPQEDARMKQSPTKKQPSSTKVAPLTAGPTPSTTSVEPATSLVVPTFRSAKASAQRSPELAEHPLPEVIVAAEDVEALRRFLSDAHDLRFVASFDETPESTPWVMTELIVAPIAGEAPNPTPSQNN